MPSLKKLRADGPMGGAGLLRYFDVDEGGPKLDPKVVIGLVVIVIVLEVMLKVILR
ncbi:MAG: preprotein translocase subunit Sec61beta [Candidatus Altiarchaeota archaeon]|nr:preprotein translocase subunit Sec61beta [Candidatus Altiarchaeota archaeon]